MGWLRNRREQMGITSQGELAARLQLEGFSVSRAAVSAWEIGRNRIPVEDPDFRRALSRILRMTEQEILRAEGYKVPEKLSEAAEKAASIVDQLPPDKQNLAIRLLEQLLTG